VQALGGFPAVNSNRWFKGSASERNLALLNLLKDTNNRQARFYSVICFFDPQKNLVKFFDGEVQGTIATRPRGSKNRGFGYDPIFIPQGYEQTFAQLGIKLKNNISHRRKALIKLSRYLLPNKHLEQLE